MGNMFGAASAPPAALPFETEAFADSFDPEENLNNPAFASDSQEDDEMSSAEMEHIYTQESATQQEELPPREQVNENGYIPGDLYCEKCGTPINERVYEYSLNKFGSPLCIKCQKGAGR